MTIEVEVVSKETIKPSSPTPHNLHTFPLSGLDQFVPSWNTPFYIFYPATRLNEEEKQERVRRLKQSLSETLTHVYPFGGRVSGNKHVTCNDEGINFFEARVHGDNLSQYLVHPQSEDLEKLLPKDELLVLEAKALLSVQVNFFDSGGMGLGLLISHQIADAFSIYLFLNCWARIARGEKVIHPPKLGTTSTFPPKDIPVFVPPTENSGDKRITKRFVFNADNVAALKTNLFTNHPSRSMAVVALIWRCIMDARRVRGVAKTPSIGSFAVNLRPKQLRDLSENSLGNCVVSVTTTPTAENRLELPDLVDKLREAIRLVDSEYPKQLEAGDLLFLEPFKKVTEQCSKGEVERYWFSSLCNFRFYETDFGWGRPIWLTAVLPIGFMKGAVLLDTKCGTGIEAWVYLDKENMVRFEHDPLLILFTSPNNSAFISSL